jgi:hypothetical protein
MLVYSNFASTNEDSIIIDSDMTFEQAVANSPAPKAVLDSLCLIDVKYYSFDGKIHKGQLVIHKAVKKDIVEIFDLIFKEKFPIGKAIPIVKYKWSDDASMEDNNTSSFNYRFIAGTKRISNHSYGKAIDINPFKNPVIHNDGSISPKGAKYDTSKPGTFSVKNVIVQEFLKRGWRWGRNFSEYKDNHHFDKP